MIEPRLTSDIQISAMKRLVEAGGGFATVLRKGDLVSGAILLIGQVRGENPVLFDRYPSISGSATWQPVALQDSENEAEISNYWQKRVSRDPDLWVIELNVASTERLNEILGTLT